MQKLQMKMIPQECYQPFQELNIIDDLSRIIFEYSIDWKVFITFYDKQVLCHQFKNMNQKFIELDLSQIVFPPWNWAYYMIYDISYSLFDKISYSLSIKETNSFCICISKKYNQILSNNLEYDRDDLNKVGFNNLLERFRIIYDLNVSKSSFELQTLCSQQINSIFIKIS